MQRGGFTRTGLTGDDDNGVVFYGVDDVVFTGGYGQSRIIGNLGHMTSAPVTFLTGPLKAVFDPG